jgi:thiol-disulfide isomerase/thioredoxin
MAKKQKTSEIRNRQRAAELRNRRKNTPIASSQTSQRQNRRIIRRKSNTAWWWIGGIVLACVIAIGVFISISNNKVQNQKAAGVVNSGDTTVFKTVTTVPSSVLSTANTGGLPASTITPIAGKPALTGSSGKPEVFYYGAEWCPYCAADRWSMVIALNRFGTFKNLAETLSSSSDVDANTATFTFVNSGYTSSYIDFVPLEVQNRDKNTIETPSTAQQQILTDFSINGFPFIDIGNKYQAGALYDPAVLANLSQKQIAQKLSNPDDTATKNIAGGANYLTAAICSTLQNKPANVCTQAPIPAIEQSLGQGQGNAQHQATGIASTAIPNEQRQRS